MSIGDLVGAAVVTYSVFTATEVLPALFWLVLTFVFLVRLDWSLGWWERIDDYMENDEDE